MKPSERGRLAEREAARYLAARGLEHLTSNYHCRWGEIDLIMQDGPSLVFVEVRFRSHNSYGGAAASVDGRKQKKLVKAALHYMQRHGAVGKPARFDVLALTPAQGAQTSADQIQWIINAFEAI
jgi:putative endonuclease